MPNKLQAYAEQAERTARQITGSHLAWTAFLTTAARLYKYPYNEQLMIYMQRPEATACAEYDFWNEKMGRYVRRGSTGIALIDATGYKPRLKYVFDVSDTGGKENARRVNLWELKEAHTDSVSAMLERNYGVSGRNGLTEQFEAVASRLASEYWRDHSRDILGIVADSYLEEYDDYNIEVAFKNAAAVSITYSLMSRCGMQPEEHFEHEDFFSIFDFNTPRTVAALGTAVSEINEQVLRQIEVTIRNYEREHSAERTAEHGEQPDLHDERRLHDSRPEDRGAGAAPRQVRADAPEVPEGASAHSLEPDDSGGSPVPAPAGDRAGGAEPLRADDAEAGVGGRSDGSSESPRPNEMGGPDEHLQGAGGGSDSRGADLRITEHPARGGQLSFFPTEAEQITAIEEAESVAQTPFAFSVSQAQLDHVLRLGGNEDNTRMVIAAAFQKQKSTEDIAALLQSTFHGGNGFKTPEGELSAWYAVDGIHIAPGRSAEYVRSAQVIAWQDAAAHISQLMDSGAYASNVELAEAGQHERMQLAQALWYLKHDLSDEAREQGYLSCMDTLRGGGFPDETARLAEQLTNTDFRETLSGEFTQFYAAHEQDRSLLRFHYHKLENIWQSLRNLSLPRRAYSSEMAAVPELGRFITEDEIDHALDRGSGVEGGKSRIYEYFTADHTGKEKAAFLKDEYGIGGRSHAVSGASHSDESHDSRGIVLKKADCANVELSWTKVAARIDSLIQKDRFLTPEEKARFEQLQREKEAERELPTQAQTDYNAIKEAHPDDIVLFQVGDFFEIYGEDAKQAAELLDLNLTTRAIPGAGRVEMCGVPAHNLEQYVERLRDKYDVTIAEAPDFRGERHIYTLRSIDHEAEAAINAYEAEFGADGTRVFRDPAAEQVQPTVQERLEHYRPVVMVAVSEDTAYRNACGHSDRENAEIECNAAVRRAVLNSKDMELIRLFSDMPEFRSRLHRETFEGTYARLHDLLRPLSQDDIDDALRAWNGNIESKHAVVRYTLNLRDVRIYDTVRDADGTEKRVLNSKETTLAQQKQQAIKEAFRDWIWKDPDRRRELVQLYNERFNSTRPREYDGRHLIFPGMNPEITLREHQRGAIAHDLYGGNTLLAHEVGAGKTFEMIAAAMEGKRLGLCQKSLFAVPNHLTEQWASEFLRLYPSANILVATKKDFETRNRKKFCARIATGDYDAVIIGHSQFERIPVSRERQERLLQEQIWEIEDGISELKASRAERFTIKELERTKKNLGTKLQKLHDAARKDDVVTFEQLGVDRLYVDEAHSFKNLFLYTKMRNVAGLSTTDAQKSSDMLLKCRYIDEITQGKGVTFATGTPISNSMTELYTMMRYLQHDMLKRNRLTHFDCWASAFGETTTAIELAPEGTGYRARTRFAKFFNLPELMNLFREAADIKTSDQLNLPTPTPVYHNEVSQPTPLQKQMVQELSERAAKVHAGSVDASTDNMLKITSDGRKLGLDQRVINPDLPDDPNSKVNLCVNNIHRIWQDGQAEKLTQLVFCDLSTPKGKAAQSGRIAAKGTDSPELHALEAAIDAETEPEEPPFTIYDDIREKLVARGIPREQIAFIHEANTEVRKKELFAKVRSGQVRVLMGSTFKMGAGMNVQDRLVALHDLDCPWRPGDLEQRSGRIIRQGNRNKEVHIYRYVTESTFDAYLWQTVENKQKFISQIMTSKSPVRSCEDIDEAALSYAEIKALCAGDERIREKMDLDVDVARLRLMKANHQSQQYRLEDNILRHFPAQIEENKGFLSGFEADMKTLEAHPHPKDGFAGMEVKGDFLTDKDNAGAAILEAFKDAKGLEPVPIGSYRGFSMSLTVENFGKDFILTLKGKMSHRVELGKDARGNLVRIDNALAQMPERYKTVQGRLENVQAQLATAKAELGKPFPQETELKEKSARLAELNAELNIDDRTPMEQAAENVVAKRPSVLGKLKAPCVHGAGEKKKSHEQEAR